MVIGNVLFIIFKINGYEKNILDLYFCLLLRVGMLLFVQCFFFMCRFRSNGLNRILENIFFKFDVFCVFFIIFLMIGFGVFNGKFICFLMLQEFFKDIEKLLFLLLRGFVFFNLDKGVIFLFKLIFVIVQFFFFFFDEVNFDLVFESVFILYFDNLILVVVDLM